MVVVLYWISQKIHTRLKMQENIRKIQMKREELETRKKTLRHKYGCQIHDLLYAGSIFQSNR